MPRELKRPLLLGDQRKAAMAAIEGIRLLAAALIKTVVEYIDALEKFQRYLITRLTDEMEASEKMRSELTARRAFDKFVRNSFGNPPANFCSRDFYRMRIGKDGRHHGYCALCDADAIEEKDDEGRATCVSIRHRHDCAGVVMGYWETETKIE